MNGDEIDDISVLVVLPDAKIIVNPGEKFVDKNVNFFSFPPF